MSKPRGATRKSLRTREAIETAAREAFAELGFERATVRDIAARAGIDPSMVIRYFGSKDQLFAHVAAPDLGLGRLAGMPPDQLGPAVVRHFLDMWEGQVGGGGLPVLLRSAGSNEEAAATLRALFVDQVMPVIAAAGPPETARARAGLVATQLLGLALTRYVLRLPPVVEMASEDLIAHIGATIQRYASGATHLSDEI